MTHARMVLSMVLACATARADSGAAVKQLAEACAALATWPGSADETVARLHATPTDRDRGGGEAGFKPAAPWRYGRVSYHPVSGERYPKAPHPTDYAAATSFTVRFAGAALPVEELARALPLPLYRRPDPTALYLYVLLPDAAASCLATFTVEPGARGLLDGAAVDAAVQLDDGIPFDKMGWRRLDAPLAPLDAADAPSLFERFHERFEGSFGSFTINPSTAPPLPKAKVAPLLHACRTLGTHPTSAARLVERLGGRPFGDVFARPGAAGGDTFTLPGPLFVGGVVLDEGELAKLYPPGSVTGRAGAWVVALWPAMDQRPTAARLVAALGAPTLWVSEASGRRALSLDAGGTRCEIGFESSANVREVVVRLSHRPLGPPAFRRAEER